MTILVTGSSGFIGFHLCKKLIQNGEKVIGFDNMNNYYDKTLKENRLSELRKIADKDKFIFILGSLEDNLILEKIFNYQFLFFLEILN